jgi:glucoamylase
MPLTWAQAEYIKLSISLRSGKVFDMPKLTTHRYLKHQHLSKWIVWRFDRPAPGMPSCRKHILGVRLEFLAPAVVHWSADEWLTHQDQPTIDSGLGVHYLDLPLARARFRIVFTVYWPSTGQWHGHCFFHF